MAGGNPSDTVLAGRAVGRKPHAAGTSSHSRPPIRAEYLNGRTTDGARVVPVIVRVDFRAGVGTYWPDAAHVEIGT